MRKFAPFLHISFIRKRNSNKFSNKEMGQMILFQLICLLVYYISPYAFERCIFLIVAQKEPVLVLVVRTFYQILVCLRSDNSNSPLHFQACYQQVIDVLQFGFHLHSECYLSEGGEVRNRCYGIFFYLYFHKNECFT